MSWPKTDAILEAIKNMGTDLKPTIETIKTNFDEWKLPWTADRAGKIDSLDVPVSTRASESALRVINDFLLDDNSINYMQASPMAYARTITSTGTQVLNNRLLQVTGKGTLHQVKMSCDPSWHQPTLKITLDDKSFGFKPDYYGANGKYNHTVECFSSKGSLLLQNPQFSINGLQSIPTGSFYTTRDVNYFMFGGFKFEKSLKIEIPDVYYIFSGPYEPPTNSKLNYSYWVSVEK